jgi:hypothetical protein
MGILKLTRLMALISLLVAGLALPAVAAAQGGDEVIRDCAQDGDLDKEYSDEELEEAEENMPSDVDAYSNCRDVIRAAQAGGRGGSEQVGGAGTGGTGGSGGDGGPNAGDTSGTDRSTPSDRTELDNRADASRNDEAPTVDNALPAGADAGDDSGLPTAALVAIALLGLAAVGGGVYLLRDYLPPGLSSRLPGASR